MPPVTIGSSLFDAVLCIDAIAQIPDRAAALADWARSLKPGENEFLFESAGLCLLRADDATDTLASERRLARIAFLAEKPR